MAHYKVASNGFKCNASIVTYQAKQLLTLRLIWQSVADGMEPLTPLASRRFAISQGKCATALA